MRGRKGVIEGSIGVVLMQWEGWGRQRREGGEK